MTDSVLVGWKAHIRAGDRSGPAPYGPYREAAEAVADVERLGEALVLVDEADTSVCTVHLDGTVLPLGDDPEILQHRMYAIQEACLLKIKSFEAVRQSKKMGEFEGNAKQLLSHLRTLSGVEDIEALLMAERVCLGLDLEHSRQEPTRTGSLTSAIQALDAAVRVVAQVREPILYQTIVASSFTLPQMLIGELPRDEARIFFSGHKTRLINLKKGDLGKVEGKLITTRLENTRLAEKLYKHQQYVALDKRPPPQQEKGKGQSQGR